MQRFSQFEKPKGLDAQRFHRFQKGFGPTTVQLVDKEGSWVENRLPFPKPWEKFFKVDTLFITWSKLINEKAFFRRSSEGPLNFTDWSFHAIYRITKCTPSAFWKKTLYDSLLVMLRRKWQSYRNSFNQRILIEQKRERSSVSIVIRLDIRATPSRRSPTTGWRSWPTSRPINWIN